MDLGIRNGNQQMDYIPKFRVTNMIFDIPKFLIFVGSISLFGFSCPSCVNPSSQNSHLMGMFHNIATRHPDRPQILLYVKFVILHCLFQISIAFPDDGAWKRFHKQLQHFPVVTICIETIVAQNWHIISVACDSEMCKNL